MPGIDRNRHLADREVSRGQPDPTLRGNARSRLRRLGEWDGHEIADGDPDVRGWAVRDGWGKAVGAVHDLLVETDTKRVRYLDVAVGLENGEAKHVVLPLGIARLHGDADVITLPTLSYQRLLSLPSYEHEEFSRNDECEVIGHIAGVAPDASRELFYDQDYFRAAEFCRDRLHRGNGTDRVEYVIVAIT